MRDYFDGVGKLVCPVIVLGQRQVQFGRAEYGRFYGQYALTTPLCKRLKMMWRNG